MSAPVRVRDRLMRTDRFAALSLQVQGLGGQEFGVGVFDGITGVALIGF